MGAGITTPSTEWSDRVTAVATSLVSVQAAKKPADRIVRRLRSDLFGSGIATS
jgi:hypothetical protein